MITRELDKDLWFLDDCSNEELEILFNILCFEVDGTPRKRGHLLHSLESQLYEQDYYKFSDKIGEELQLIANTSIGNLLRNKKNSYFEVIALAFDALKIKFDNNLSPIHLEKVLINTLNDRVIGLNNSGLISLPFEVLIEEAFTKEIENNPVLRCIIPSIIYISLLRSNLGKNKLQEGKETILK